jgi:hypothetical protein
LTDVDPKFSSPPKGEDPQSQTGDPCGAIEKIFFSWGRLGQTIWNAAKGLPLHFLYRRDLSPICGKEIAASMPF